VSPEEVLLAHSDEAKPASVNLLPTSQDRSISGFGLNGRLAIREGAGAVAARIAGPAIVGDNLIVAHMLFRCGETAAGARMRFSVERLKFAMAEAIEGGLFTRRSLSKAAGLQADAARDILDGRNVNPTIHTVNRIADALGCSVEAFLDDDDELRSL
jgi:hypothetical protein